MSLRNIRLVMEYDGSAYHGWQSQPHGKTIQDTLEGCLRKLTGEPIRVIASGRTDAGVHAEGQVVNFPTTTSLSPQTLLRGCNSLLPRDIVIREASEVPLSFHARFSAKSKTYRYQLLNRPIPSVFYRRFAWFVPYPLQLPPMQEALAGLKGTHDFSSFCAASSRARAFTRTLLRAELLPLGDLLAVYVQANGFLQYMVRAIVGTLVEVGAGKRPGEEVAALLARRDRTLAGPTAPAHGLILESVEY